MRVFTFKYLKPNGITKNSLFAISGSEPELLETMWVKLRGKKYNNEHGMMRNHEDIECRLFEDFSGLLGNSDGEIYLDEEHNSIYVTNYIIENWFAQVDVLDGPIGEAYSMEIAMRIFKMKKQSPLSIIKNKAALNSLYVSKK